MTLLFPSINRNFRKKHQKIPLLKWSTVKSVFAYSSITKKCLLHNFIHHSLNSVSAQVQILVAACRRLCHDPNPEELLNKHSELVSKCRYANNHSSKNYKGSD